MSWSALMLSAVLSATPAKRLNFEPLLLGGLGLACGLVGVGAFVSAEQTFVALQGIRTDDVTSREVALARVAQAHALRDRGVSETGLGTTMVGLGAALLTGAVVWFIVEGATVSAALTPTRDGVLAGALVRF